MREEESTTFPWWHVAARESDPFSGAMRRRGQGFGRGPTFEPTPGRWFRLACSPMRRPRRFAASTGAAILVVATLGVAALTEVAFGASTAAALPSPTADIVVDAATGRVLIGDQVHLAVHPASTAKIM